MANRNPKGVEYMREIGRRGGQISGSRRLNMYITRRKLIAVHAARCRWGLQKYTPEQEIAWLEGWAHGVDYGFYGSRASSLLRKRAKKPLGKGLAGVVNL
jgi:hypothetical protein